MSHNTIKKPRGSESDCAYCYIFMIDSMPDYTEAIREEEAKQNKLYIDVVKPILKGSSIEFAELFEEYTEEGSCWGWRISDAPEAGRDELLDGDLKVFIDQSGGYSGDDYTGVVSLEMDNGKYISWDYAM